MIKKIGILTGGGDCSGLNAVINGITKAAITSYGLEVIGYMKGYNGLYHNDFVTLDLKAVSGIMHEGGTMLKASNKDNLFNYRTVDKNGNVTFLDVSDVAIANMKKEGVEGLIIIGGDGTLTSARDFSRKGVNVIGVPKTIDNDLPATEMTFGYNTSLENIVDALDKIHTTAASHDRIIVVEVMGRNTGWLALEGGIAGSADIILIPEIPYDLEKIIAKIQKRIKSGKEFSIVVVSEGAMPIGGEIHVRQYVEDSADTIRLGGIGDVIHHQIAERIKDYEVRYTNLSYIQRGGTASQFDREIGLRFGVQALDLMMSGQYGQMVRYKAGQVDSVDLEDVVGRGETGETSKGGAKFVDPKGQIVHTAKMIGISFGDE